jgi:hypothetical protein
MAPFRGIVDDFEGGAKGQENALTLRAEEQSLGSKYAANMDIGDERFVVLVHFVGPVCSLAHSLCDDQPLTHYCKRVGPPVTISTR